MTYENALLEILESDDRYVVMTAENRAAIRNLPELIGSRFIDTGITEQAMVGMAAGLALKGRIPILHALAAFITMRSFEFVRTDVGIPGLPVKLVGYVPGILSDGNGATHQAVEDVALMRGIPSMNVFCPADNEDLLLGLPAVLQDPAPWYIRFTDRPATVRHSSEFQIGKAEVFSHGTDVALLAYGPLFAEARAASAILEEQGLSVRLINIRTVKPIDVDVVTQALEECDVCMTIEDHFIRGGLYSVVAELCLERQIRNVAVLPIGLDDAWYKPATLDQAMHHAGFTGAQIAERALTLLSVVL